MDVTDSKPLHVVATSFCEAEINGCKILAEQIKYQLADDHSAAFNFMTVRPNPELEELATTNDRLKVMSYPHKMWSDIEIHLNPSEMRQYEGSLRSLYTVTENDL